MGLASGKKEQDLAHSRQLWGSKGVREESRGVQLGVVEKCVALPHPPTQMGDFSLAYWKQRTAFQ